VSEERPPAIPLLAPSVRAALGALAGLAVAAGGAPLEAFGLPWAGVLVLHLLLVDAERERRPLRAGALVGLAAGFAANAASMAWAVGLFEEHGFMPLPLALLLSVLLWLAQALPLAVVGALRGAIVRSAPAHPALATVIAVVVAGGISPMFFPWRLGTSQTALPLLASWAWLSGVSLVDAMLTAPTALLAEALRRRAPRSALSALGVLVLALGGGALVHRTLEAARAERDVARIGVAHTVLTIAERHDPVMWEHDHLALLEETWTLEAQGAELVLWPETAYPFQWRRGLTHDPVGLESVLSRGVRGPVVFGTITWDRHHRFNSVVAIERDGSLAGIVDKRVLMPFSERIPFVEWIQPHFPEVPEGLTPAPSPGALMVGGRSIGVLNCYEDLDAGHTRWLVDELGPELLTNHTNDAWFGPHAAELHLFLSRLRAIETGRDLVRAVNGGVSAHVASTGEVLVRRGPVEPGGLSAEVRLARSPTPFVRFGDLALAGALGCLLALFGWRARER
jgi:apolipoprotein N-acyltransferase